MSNKKIGGNIVQNYDESGGIACDDWCAPFNALREVDHDKTYGCYYENFT